MLGTHVDQDVVILSADWDNELAQATYSLGLPGLAELAMPLHHHCHVRGVRCGFASPGDDLSRAKVAFLPHLPIWREGWTDNLQKFVMAGGVLVVGARSGTRNANNHILTDPAPGPLAALCGVTVSEFGRLPAAGARSILSGGVFQVEARSGGRAAESARRIHSIDLPGGKPIQAALGYEVLEPMTGTQVLARWSSRFLAGLPAITRRALGEGAVIYAGTYLTPALTERLFDPLFAAAGVEPVFTGIPHGVEVTTRSAAGRRLTFVQNTGDAPVEAPTPEGMVQLRPYEVKVFVERADARVGVAAE